MKKQILSLILVAGLTGGAHASLATFSSGALGQTILDGDLNGVSSTIGVTVDRGAVIDSMTVTLNISGGYNGDLYAYLSYGGNKAILLNRVGRTSAGDLSTYGDSGFIVTLGISGSDIHNYQGSLNYPSALNGNGQLTGNWQADGRDVNPASVLDTDDRNAGLGVFNNVNPNGTWTLFLSDSVGSGGPSTLDSWSMDISTVPEPVNCALLGFVGVAMLTKLSLRWRKKSPVAH